MPIHYLACPTCGQSFDSQLGGNDPLMKCPACGARFARVSAAAVAPPIRALAEGHSPEYQALRTELGRSGKLMLWFVITGLAIGFIQVLSNLLQPVDPAAPGGRASQVVGTVIGLLIGMLPYYYLFRSTQRTSRFLATNRPQDLGAALVAQSGYWKTLVVLIAIGIGFGIFAVMAAIALG
jgi:hypothetical protein